LKILLIHNKYKHSGGEDSVFENEKALLEKYNHNVKTLFFNNNEIEGIAEKIKLTYKLLYNRTSEKIVDQAITYFKPDVIHVHNLFYIASPSILFSAYKNNIPVVLTLHNYRLICSGSLLMRNSKPCELCINKKFPIDGIKYGCHHNSVIGTAQLTLTTGMHKVLKTWNEKVSMYISQTEFARQKFINSSLNLLPEQIVVKPTSTDNVEPSDFHERENYFLFVGRLSEEKGVEVLLKAFEGKKTTIEIIGDGPLKHMVEKLSATNANIIYSGYRDKSYIISRLRKCKALIVPSICYESIPTTILEAFSTGTPIIISDIGNLNEIVSHKYNGVHFKTNDPTDLNRIVDDFNRNNFQYELLYQNARKTYLEKYTPEINYKNLIDIYNSAIKFKRKVAFV
jgi:glycosyltransferase involved in cell wall biosynthesis